MKRFLQIHSNKSSDTKKSSYQSSVTTITHKHSPDINKSSRTMTSAPCVVFKIGISQTTDSVTVKVIVEI